MSSTSEAAAISPMPVATAARGKLRAKLASQAAEILRDVRRADWTLTNARAGLLCLPVVTAWIFIGVLGERRELAVRGVAGAVAVAFGAFQNFGRRRLGPMFLTLLGIVAATCIGSYAAYLGWPFVTITGTLLAFAFGVLTSLGFAAWWVGLQCMIGLLVYGSRPADFEHAAITSFHVFLGGFSQLLALSLLLPLANHWFRRTTVPPLDVDEAVIRQFLHNASPATLAGRYALRVSLAMLLALTVAYLWRRHWGAGNAYWVPMTAIILLKPDLRETSVRGFNRLAGTLGGAVVATLIVSLLRPDPPQLSLLLMLAIWGCFTLQRVHYAIFATCITAYVVLLLSLIGLPEPQVATHRIIATLLGAAIALLVHVVRVPHLRPMV